jgi:hypothetical protein
VRLTQDLELAQAQQTVESGSQAREIVDMLTTDIANSHNACVNLGEQIKGTKSQVQHIEH